MGPRRQVAKYKNINFDKCMKERKKGVGMYVCNLSEVWWCISVTPVFGILGQEEQEF